MPSGLHDRVLRILHWELNVRDLDLSIAFLESFTELRASTAVDAGDHRAAVLLPPSGLPGLRLVQWHGGPHGTPHDRIGAIGFTRVVLHVADLDAARSRAESLGISPVAPTTGDDFRFELGSRGSTAYRAWSCLDPDGIVVELLENPVPKVSTVAQGTADLATARGFLTEVLGFDVVDTVATPGPVPNVYLPNGDPVEFRGVFLRVTGEERGYLDVLEHRHPTARRPPYDSPRHLGVTHVALEVDDLDAAWTILRVTPWRGEPVAVDGDVSELDLGGMLGTRRVLDLRDPEGVRYRLVGAG